MITPRSCGFDVGPQLYSGWLWYPLTARRTAPSANRFGAKLIRSRLAGIPKAVSASVQWPAVRKTRTETRVPEQNSPTLPSGRTTRIAPTFGWVVSIVPHVIAEAGDPSAVNPMTARTPQTSKTRQRTNPIATTSNPRRGWSENAINFGGDDAS